MATRFAGVLLVVAVLGAFLALPARADHLFSPTDKEITAWLNDGIEAAGADANLMALPGVSRWIWTNEPAGLPLQSGRIIRFLVIATPQLIATFAGWQAAWDEETWGKLQNDETYETAMAELVKQVRAGLGKKSLTVAVGSTRTLIMEGKGFSAQLSGLVFGNGSWYDLHVGPAQPMGMYAKAEATDKPKGEWAARCAAAGMAEKNMVRDPGGIEVSQCQLNTGGQSSNRKWIAQIEAPLGMSATSALFVLGNVDSFATVVMNVGP